MDLEEVADWLDQAARFQAELNEAAKGDAS